MEGDAQEHFDAEIEGNEIVTKEEPSKKPLKKPVCNNSQPQKLTPISYQAQYIEAWSKWIQCLSQGKNPFYPFLQKYQIIKIDKSEIKRWDNQTLQIADVVAGDDTGVSQVRLKDDIVSTLELGDVIAIRNGKV